MAVSVKQFANLGLDLLLREIEGFFSQVVNAPGWVYYSNIKKFALKVGCPEAHEDAERNIAELRKFNATQMPFFQKLQDDLQAKIKENNQQQEIITALVFRHLIEHLPPNPYRNRTNATDRWLAFWEDAVKKEYNDPTKHPLQGLVDEKIFPKLPAPLVNPTTNVPMTRGTTGKIVDRDTSATAAIDERGEKAQMYRLGKELFGILSKNIHAFEGKGKEGYQIGSDHWGKAVRDILERLRPIEYDINGDTSEVNWTRERARYGIP
jgi:hypothetical protein